MQKINYRENIKLKNKIDELLLINIDEKLSQSIDNDNIKVYGQITISGEVTSENDKENFVHPLEVDIILSKDQLVNEQVFVSVDDFEYKLLDNTIEINLIIKIDGLKEIEPYFPPQENTEDPQIDNRIQQQEEINELAPVEIEKSLDTQIENEPNIVQEIPVTNNPTKYSLLNQIFRNKITKKDSTHLFHVVKQPTTYQEISQLYNVDIEKLKSCNNDEEIYIGKLILIPKE